MKGVTLSEWDAARLPEFLKGIPRSIQILAFGSRVTGKSRPFSDLDLCLKGAPNLSDSQLAEVREKFQLSDLSIKVDLVRYEDLPLSFQAEVDSVGIPIPLPQSDSGSASG